VLALDVGRDAPVLPNRKNPTRPVKTVFVSASGPTGRPSRRALSADVSTIISPASSEVGLKVASPSPSQRS
jgi:hypothetical protein